MDAAAIFLREETRQAGKKSMRRRAHPPAARGLCSGLLLRAARRWTVFAEGHRHEALRTQHEIKKPVAVDTHSCTWRSGFYPGVSVRPSLSIHLGCSRNICMNASVHDSLGGADYWLYS